MNQKKSRRHSHNKTTGKYDRQRKRTDANKRKAMARHLQDNPNDKQAKDSQ